MKLKQRRYSKGLQQRIVTEYLTTDISQEELRRRHGIGGKSTITRWIRELELEARDKNDTLVEMKSKNKPEDPKKLAQRIRELEKALQEAELKAIAYQKLVENAEKELGISLPKKSATKRSRS